MRVLLAVVAVLVSTWVLELGRGNLEISRFNVGGTPVTSFELPGADGPPVVIMLAAGGKRPEGAQYDKGFWVEPTVFTGVTMDMRIAQEEVFGPVLSALKWRDEDEAIRMANAVDLGLTASIWTRDLDRALRFTREVEAGYVWVNGCGTHFRNVPHGGFKNSGTGREEGIDELLSYTEVKAVNILGG